MNIDNLNSTNDVDDIYFSKEFIILIETYLPSLRSEVEKFISKY